jgi:PrtD family type I secretion system ABC transporter
MWPAIKAVTTISLFMNLLAFAPALYMMSAFDRVLASRNLVTWVFLTVIFVVLSIAYAVLSSLRNRTLVRVGMAFDESLSDRLFEAVQRAMLSRSAAQGVVTPVQAMRDLDVIRENLSGKLVAAAVDLCFAPLFLLVCFMLHPLIGVAVLVMMVAVVALGFAVNLASAGATLRSTAASIHASEFAASMLRNSEVIQALGMTRVLQQRWRKLRDAGLSWNAKSSDTAVWAGISLNVIIFAGSTLVSAVALLLILENLASAHILFGAMVISAKAIAPMTQLASNWKSFTSAEYSFHRIDRLFEALPDLPERMQLPRPTGHLTVENVTALAPGGSRQVLRNLSFELEAGQVLGVIGPSAAGKSSLARVLVGVWPVSGGAVRLDGNELTHWDPHELGRHVGYIPQDVELFAGTVAENIARFGPAESDAVIAAATLAGVHDMIQGLPDGYNTEIGDGGVRLSGGQRQRIALARAVFGMPPLIVLDEPNASLDTRGEESLAEAIRQLRRAGSTVVIVTHRSNMISQVDRILLMTDGTAHLYGTREEVMKRLGMPNVVPMAPLAQPKTETPAAASGSSPRPSGPQTWVPAALRTGAR